MQARFLAELSLDCLQVDIEEARCRLFPCMATVTDLHCNLVPQVAQLVHDYANAGQVIVMRAKNINEEKKFHEILNGTGREEWDTLREDLLQHLSGAKRLTPYVPSRQRHLMPIHESCLFVPERQDRTAPLFNIGQILISFPDRWLTQCRWFSTPHFHRAKTHYVAESDKLCLHTSIRASMGEDDRERSALSRAVVGSFPSATTDVYLIGEA